MPDLAEVHYELAVAWARPGNFEGATNCCENALRLNAALPQALAERAASLTGTTEPAYLDALAAAYAADGQFSKAVITAEKALALAGGAGAVQLRNQIGQRLNLYRAGHPYRTGLPAPLPSDW